MRNTLKLAALLCVLSAPVSAEVPCAGIADTMANLLMNGFSPSDSGNIPGGIVTVYTNPDGRFVVVYTDDSMACLVQTGTDWGPVKPNA